MRKGEVRARIEDIGIIPGIRAWSYDNAKFAVEAVYRAGIPIAEVTMTVPNAVRLISELTQSLPDMVIGAGTVLNIETAERCLAAGAKFLTSTGFVQEVVEFARLNDVLVFPGAMTPTDVISAWRAGADLVKIYPCAPLGGPSYIRALKLPFPQISLIATGGVTQQNAENFILAGASALGVGSELIDPEGSDKAEEQQIRELARRFLGMVKSGRIKKHGGDPDAK